MEGNRVCRKDTKCINKIAYVENRSPQRPGVLDVHFVFSLLVIGIVGGYVKRAR